MRYECHICIESLALDAFRALPCGHTLCVTCVQQLHSVGTRGRRECPQCRKGFTLDNIHPIYLTVSDDPSSQADPELPDQEEGTSTGKRYSVNFSKGTLRQAQRAAASITEADLQAGGKVEKVRRIVQEIDKVTNSMDGNVYNISILLSAMSHFCERLVLVLTDASRREAELATLTTKYQSLSKEHSALRREKDKAERLVDEALSTAERVKREYDNANAERERLVKRRDEKEKENNDKIKEQAAEITRWKACMQTYKKKEKEHAQTIESLKAQVTTQERTIQRLQAVPQTPIRFRSGVSPTTAGHSRLMFSQNSPGCSSQSGLSEEDIYAMAHAQPRDYVDLEAEAESPAGRLPALLPDLVEEQEKTPPRKPIFASDWNLQKPGERKRKRGDAVQTLPLQLDAKGRLKGPVQLGPRQRFNFK